MATRIETLGSDRRAPTAWFMLLALVLIAAVLTVGALIGSGVETSAPARSTSENAAAVAPAQAVPGLIKAGLQPRPYSPIETADADIEIPRGFIQMPGGEVRPMPGS